MYSSCLLAAEMVQVTPFFLVLSLVLADPAFSAGECELTGDWINSLGHIMIIGPVDEQGNFNGSYLKEIEPARLEGLQLRMNQNRQTIFGFIVYWNFSVYFSVFTGQCILDETGKEVLKTTWLDLSRIDNWKPLMIGSTNFTRQYWRKRGSIVGGCKADRSARDADPISYPTTCF